ncbi:MAG: helicase-related protein, partial [Caldilinea sp.]|nr:helicase-related protein [Caldilinea sp.]
MRVARLSTFPRRLLVATDCLSEGVNLQDHFDAVVHYDLSWNPTRHEQREGRVDRYGQPSPTVRTLTYYGVDNPIDGIVLDVLLRKHRTIRSSLGISVPVPASTQEAVQALMQGVMLRGEKILGGGQLNFLDVKTGFGSAQLAALNAQWENVTEKERSSHTLFAQSTLGTHEVAQEWAAMRDAIGSGVDVRSFVTQTVQLHGGTVSYEPALDCWRLLLPDGALQDTANGEHIVLARFDLPVSD